MFYNWLQFEFKINKVENLFLFSRIFFYLFISHSEIPAPTTPMTTEVYHLNRSRVKNRKKYLSSFVTVGDYGVEEWKDNNGINNCALFILHCSNFHLFSHARELDYNGDFSLPSRGPPPIRHPPGAYHNNSHPPFIAPSTSALVILAIILIVMTPMLMRWEHSFPPEGTTHFATLLQ